MRKFCIFFVFLLILFTACGTVPAVNLLPVCLAPAEGMTVTGDNPQYVSPGGTAVFDVSFTDGYVPITLPQGAKYNAEEGTISLSSVRFPTTVEIKTWQNPATYKFFIDNKGGGRALSTVDQGKLYEGTDITITAEPQEGYIFRGWSFKKYLSDGGELYSAEAEVAFTLAKDMNLCANFTKSQAIASTVTKNTTKKERDRDPEKTVTVVYDANGGIVTKTGETVLRSPFELSIYKYPNTLAAQDNFFRAGYALIGYNTKADGTGDYYGFGWKALETADTKKEIHLYCMWEKETDLADFGFTDTGDGYMLSSYKGDAEKVIVPAYVNGQPVTCIASYAFNGKKCETLLIPKTVTTLDVNAVHNCANLSTVYIYDSMRVIKNNSLSGTTKIHKLLWQAVLDPVFATNVEGNFCRKFEWLVSAPSPKIVVESGSSSLYSINSNLMEEISGGKYSVVNYGTTAHTCGCAYLEMISHFVGEGDIVIHAPELDSTQAGSSSLSIGFYRAVEEYYNIFYYIDIAKYTNIFAAFVEYNDVRVESESQTYEDWGGKLYEKGDRENSEELNKDTYHAGSTFNYRANAYSATSLANLKQAYDTVLATGAEMYFSIAPCNLNAVSANAKKPETQEAYMTWLRSAISVPVIGELSEYIFEGKYMFNSDWHPNGIGRDMRTKLLYEELMAYRTEHGIE